MGKPTESAVVQRAESLDQLAARIKAEFAVAEQGQRQAVTAYRKIGQALLIAKSACKHGDWLPWLKKNCPFSERHARNYMQLAKSAVTADLESVWRTILGNPVPDEEESGGKDGKQYRDTQAKAQVSTVDTCPEKQAAESAPRAVQHFVNREEPARLTACPDNPFPLVIE